MYLEQRIDMPASGVGSWLYTADCHSSSDWQFKQTAAVSLPAVILKAGWLGCWAACFLPWRVVG